MELYNINGEWVNINHILTIRESIYNEGEWYVDFINDYQLQITDAKANELITIFKHRSIGVNN